MMNLITKNLIYKVLISLFFFLVIVYNTTSVIKKIPLGVYNLHNSLLPSYKGSGANIWPIIDNQTFSGVSLHRVTERVDSGQLLLKKILINKTETGLTLFKKQQKEMINLLKKKIIIFS